MSSFALVCLTASLTVGQRDEKVLVNAPPIVVKDSPAYGREDRFRRMNQLLYYHIYWGFNYHRPENRGEWGDPNRDLSRLPTSYYHPHGPLGRALARYDWFPGPLNTYRADARLPASLVGLGGQPLAQLASAWTEPPIAVLGMGVGTPAAYARPFQVMHFVERDAAKVELSRPTSGLPPYFRFLADAQDRGAAVKVYQGEHRDAFAKRGGARFYRLIVVETVRGGRLQPVDEALLTREGVQMLVSKLSDGGVLCYHTSHRYVMHERVIASVAADLGYASRVGRDYGPPNDEAGHFTSAWVMVARRPEHLAYLKEPPGYAEQKKLRPGAGAYWSTVKGDGRWVWTDAGPRAYRGLWRADPWFAEAGNQLRSFQLYLMRRTGLRYETADRFFRPAQAALGKVHAVVLRLRNGE